MKIERALAKLHSVKINLNNFLNWIINDGILYSSLLVILHKTLFYVPAKML